LLRHSVVAPKVSSDRQSYEQQVFRGGLSLTSNDLKPGFARRLFCYNYAHAQTKTHAKRFKYPSCAVMEMQDGWGVADREVSADADRLSELRTTHHLSAGCGPRLEARERARPVHATRPHHEFCGGRISHR